MTRDHDEQRAPEYDDGIRETPRAPTATSADATKQVQEFAETAKGSAKDMPRLLHMMNNRDHNASGVLLPKLAKRMDGDLFLQCAEAFDYLVYFAIGAAVETASPPATDAALRRYLRSRTVETIVELDAHTKILADVRKLLPRALGLELPVLAHLPTEMHTKHNLMKWYVESTDPAVAAVELASAGTAEMTATLDAIDGWAWLDKLAIGGGVKFASSLQTFANTTKNAAAKQKLTVMRQKAPAPNADSTQFQTDARAELNASMGGKVSTPELLDMTARAGMIDLRPLDSMNDKTPRITPGRSRRYD